MEVIKRFLRDESGATAIEYGLIAAGISVAIITVVNRLGSQLKSTSSRRTWRRRENDWSAVVAEQCLAVLVAELAVRVRAVFHSGVWRLCPGTRSYVQAHAKGCQTAPCR
jgi:pilus assembly protein Flp/PilA